MEELEPRLLFSADLPGVLAQSGLLGGEADPTPPAIVALVDAPAVGVTIGNSEESNTESGFSLSQPKSSPPRSRGSWCSSTPAPRTTSSSSTIS